jgi:hypothetical protein
VFLTSSRVQVVIPMTPEPPSSLITKTNHLHSRNTQLPSPVTPSTHQSPPSPSHSPQTNSISSNQYNALNANARNNLVPLRGFVHKVLGRSRTSGSVLQTALCYLEAIRSKVPERGNELEMKKILVRVIESFKAILKCLKKRSLPKLSTHPRRLIRRRVRV